jgi:hypothetical protein
MSADLLHRIRWANVARAAAILLALALVIGWPRVRPHADPLPPAVAAPALPDRLATTELAGDEPAPAAARAPRAKPRRRSKPPARPRAAGPRTAPHRARTDRHRKARAPRTTRPRAAASPAPARAPAPAVAPPVAAPRSPVPVGAEFRP